MTTSVLTDVRSVVKGGQTIAVSIETQRNPLCSENGFFQPQQQEVHDDNH